MSRKPHGPADLTDPIVAEVWTAAFMDASDYLPPLEAVDWADFYVTDAGALPIAVARLKVALLDAAGLLVDGYMRALNRVSPSLTTGLRPAAVLLVGYLIVAALTLAIPALV